MKVRMPFFIDGADLASFVFLMVEEDSFLGFLKA